MDEREAPAGDYEQLVQWYKAAADHSHKWREEARQCYDFVAGTQWTESETAALQTQERPVITFNRVASVVDSVCGLEVNNRQEVHFIPRKPGKVQVNEVLSAGAKWVRDECNAEDEESDCFRDLVICGMGHTETRMDYDMDPSGVAVIRRIDPTDFYWDPGSSRKNLSDARFIFHVRDVTTEEAEDAAPGVPIDQLDAEFARDYMDSAKDPHNAQEAPFYRTDQSGQLNGERQRVRLVEAQWWDYERRWVVVNPETKEKQTLDRKGYDALCDMCKLAGIPEPVAARQDRKIYYRALLGKKILKVIAGPEQGGFTIKSMTGKRNRNKQTWYGLVSAMLDPQRWANKWLSQTLHIINSNAKGGILAERTAFEDTADAEESWARSDRITWANDGALAGNKIQPKPQATFPAGMDSLMQFAISSIRDVSGVNLELLGMADREQAGVLETQRKQAGLTILAPLFDALRLYRKEQGRLLLYYIQQFMSDERLIRVGDDENAQYVTLAKDQTVGEFDVVVDDTPTSPNMVERTWSMLLQMLPTLQGLQLPPPVWIEIMKYSPLPSSLISKIQQMVQQQGQQAQQQPDPKVDLIKAQTQKESTAAQLNMAKAENEHAKAHGSLLVDSAQADRAHSDALHKVVLAGTAQQQSEHGAVTNLMDQFTHPAVMPPQPEQPQ